ncbi:MAG: transglycosylase SLT domain-containing protein [Roseiflexaceae bacterium]
MRFVSYHARLCRALLLVLLLALLPACDVVDLGGETAPARPPAALLPTSDAPPPINIPATDLLARALRAREVGDDDAAAVDLHALMTTYPNTPESRAASFYLAESFARRARWSSAADALRAFLASGPQDTLAARALFLLARSAEEAGDWAGAVEQYGRYRALKTTLEPYALLREAAQRRALGQRAEAAAAFEAATAFDIARGERAGAYEKAIALRRELGQNDAALALYGTLLDFAESPDYRARILSEAAALAREQGQPDTARAWLREIVERAPATAQALDATSQLLADPQGGLNPSLAAAVFEIHEQYPQAITQYDAAIAAGGEQAPELRRRRALALRATGDFIGALDELEAVRAAAPDSETGRQARLDWVQTRGQSGETQVAVDGYRLFAETFPDDPRAPEALSRVAILLERLGDPEGAAQQRLDLGRRYPSTAQAREALDEAAWHFYRTGQTGAAQQAWDLLRGSTKGWVAAQAAFWSARMAPPGSPQQQELLNAAIAAAPVSYYAERAAELLGLPPAQGTLRIGESLPETQWRAAESWLAEWSGQPLYTLAERGYPPEVAQDSAVQRAIALAEVGLQTESIGEWNEARRRWTQDPIKLYLLARLAHERNMPYIALKTTEDVLALAPEERNDTPEALRHLLFPTPYGDVVLAQAREHGLDPRALYAMMRQESLFNPGATSWVGARGLAQVMPATAQGIAQRLGVDGFQESDLYRPAVSVRFGAFYLSNQIAAMNGSLLAGLAAYNGGPGNAQRWAGGDTVSDPDLFTEGIDYAETRNYVKLVYGFYGAYQRLYLLP